MDKIDFMVPSLKQSIECLKLSEGKVNCQEFVKQLEHIYTLLNETKQKIDAISISLEPVQDSSALQGRSEECTVCYFALFYQRLATNVQNLPNVAKKFCSL